MNTVLLCVCVSMCQVLDKKKVKVLVRSDELKRRYKHDPVIISFEWGKGVVYHMISHFYLQRSETRTKKQGRMWLLYAEWLQLRYTITCTDIIAVLLL